MVSIDPSQAQPRTQAHAPRAAQANAAQQIPATNFRRHFAIADGDCVFRVLHMDLTNSPGEQASNQRVMELRQTAANYVTEHRQALIAHPSFGGAAGVNDLYDLLVTQGQWNEDAGDLVAPILARVLGRELRILQPAQQAGVYEMNDNRIFRPQDPGLPPGRPDTGQPPIHLLHTGSGTHYEYLESRSPQADATAGSVHTHTRPVAHSVDDLGAPPFPQASPLGRMSPSLWLEEFARGQENSPTQGNLSRNSSLESMSSRRWLDMLALEQANSAGNLYRASSFGSISSGNISLDSQSSIKLLKELDREQGNSAPSGSVLRASSFGSTSSENVSLGNISLDYSVNSQSSRKLLDKLTREEKNRKVDDVAQPPRKRRRMVEPQTSLGNKKVNTQSARTKINKAFTQANSLAFEALTQDAEVTRISRVTGYVQSGVRKTLTGVGTKRVQTQAARTRISNAFVQENDRPFGTLTQDEQDAEVTRISRETGYNQSGIRTTLAGEGNKKIQTLRARTEILNAFTQVNDRAFSELTEHEQATQITRISQETGYNPSGVRNTLIGRGNIEVRTKRARTEIINAFAHTNNRAFAALTQQKQNTEITRISQKTGYNLSGVRTTLTGEGNKRLKRQAARIQIRNAFTQTNDRAFGSLTQHKQDAEVTRISQETGYKPSTVRTTLTGWGNKKVNTQEARTQIITVFTQANDHAFNALTPDEQDAEVTRISQETGYRPSGVRTTLTGWGNKQVQTPAARTQIGNAFTQTNDRAFSELTQHEQAAEITRISLETGYRPSGIRATLTGVGTTKTQTHKARTTIINEFTQANNRAFEALTPDEQDAEVIRISRKTGYNPTGVRSTLAGEGTIQVRKQPARTAIINAFNQSNNRAFSELTPHEQNAEITRISRKTGYVLSGVRKTLTEGGVLDCRDLILQGTF